MKLRQNQKGDVGLWFISVIVVLVVAGFAGWRVYQARQADKSQPVPTTQTVETPQDKQTFTSQEWGFKLTVPTYISENPQFDLMKTSETGKAYTVSFQDKIYIGFVTRDAPKSDLDYGFTSYNECEPNFKVVETVLVHKDETSCVALSRYTSDGPTATEEPTEVVSILAQKKFSDGAKIAGIGVSMQPIAWDESDSKDIKTAYDAEMIEAITELVKSIQEI